jgi:PAS domain S-box-containing protein
MSFPTEQFLIVEGGAEAASRAAGLLREAGFKTRLFPIGTAGPETSHPPPLPFCRRVLESIQEGIWVSDEEDVVRYANAGFERITGFGRDEIVGRKLFDGLTPGAPDELRARYLAAKESLSPACYETRARTRDGRESRQSGWLVPILEGGRFAGMIATARDITSRVRAEDELKKSLESQEILMQEIQHRVKNSLNVVSSILRIEKDGLADEKAQAVFADAIARIRSISGVYEHLARSDDHSSVAFDLYVRDIVDSVFASESVGAGVVLRSELAPARLDAKRAVPLGLILNELLTNALKYAYPSGGPGEIRVALEAEGGFLALRVEDDGAGFAPGFDLAASPGLGMTLVRMLSEQVGGELEVLGGKGTRVGVRLAL